METGGDGLVAVEFLDGTIFQLYGDGKVSLDEFGYGARNSALLRVIKGQFGFVAGKLVDAGTLVIDTPLATIRSKLPPVGFGSLAFTAFVFCFIRDVEASSQHFALIENGKISYKDLVHGIYDLITKEANPRLIVVDDPEETIILRPFGSTISVSHVTNSASQMAQLQSAYESAFSTYAQGQQDPVLQQMQQGGGPNDRADAQPQSIRSERATTINPQLSPQNQTGLTGGTGSAQQTGTTVLAEIVVATTSSSAGTVGSLPTSHDTPIVIGPVASGSSAVTIPATIRTLPISNDQHTAVFLGPSNGSNTQVPLSVTVPAAQTLVSIGISGLPAGQVITDGFGNTYSGNNFTIAAANFLSGLTLSGSAGSAALTVTAIVSGPSGLATTTATLILTEDLQGPVRWINSSGGDWNTPGNWSIGSVPIPHEDVIIDAPGTYTITSSAAVSIDSLLISNPGTTLNISGGSFSLASAGASPLSNAGTISIAAGANLIVGQAAFSGSVLNSGKLLVNGGKLDLLNLAVVNTGTVQVAASSILDLNTSSIASGILTNSGTLNFTGASSLDGITVTNNGVLDVVSGTLTLDLSTAVNNLGGTIKVDGPATLVLDTATITDGILSNAGTLEVSVGSNSINNADVTNTGTINVTGGTLTFDQLVYHTITNLNLIAANGGEIDVSNDHIINFGTLEAINDGTLKLTNLAVDNSGGTITVDARSKLYLSGVSVDNCGTLGNAGHLYAVNGANTVTAAVANTGTIEVQGGTLDLAGGLTGVGALIIDDTATLELAGADAQTVTFAGGTNTLQLDHVAGQSYTGTIKGQSSSGGTFTITGDADIASTSGDALDFTASGGGALAPADIVLTPTGTLTGAARGIAVTQNGVGDISLTAVNDVAGLGGDGIRLFDGATGSGDITVINLTGKATGTGAGSGGVHVENQNAGNDGAITVKQLGGATGGAYGIDATTLGAGDISIEAGGSVAGTAIYGIRARSYGSGSQLITTDAGSALTSGSSGIVAVNRAVSINSDAGSTITVNAHGTINSGSSNNQSGNPPAGIQAGFTGDTTATSANMSVNGTVIINNSANINAAAGYAIHAYNYGNGDVTVNDEAGTSVTGASMGIRALALSGGKGDVTVNVGAGAHVTGTASYAIQAYSIDAGDLTVSLSSGNVLNSGSSGIIAVNYSTAITTDVHSTIHVTAHGSIHSGSNPNENGSTQGAIIAGYNPGGAGFFNNQVNGDVVVESDATITADAGYGIEAFTWGVGDLTVTTGESSSITAAGTAIGAFDFGGGDVDVTNKGSATGAIGLHAYANGGGDITIGNDGHITGVSGVGIRVIQNDAGSNGSIHILNTGTAVGGNGFAAIYIQENATGSALIDSSGTIGPSNAGTVTSTTWAIVETGGTITINNTGHVNGNISVASATFNNKDAGTWTVAGASIFGTPSMIDNAGQIDLRGASISGNGLSIINSNEIDSWGTSSISGTIANTGSIEVNDGMLTLFGSVSGTGSIIINEGATLKLDGSIFQTVMFSGSGSSLLQVDTQTFGGTISGLAVGDKIDLSAIDYDVGITTTYDAQTGNLTVTDAYSHAITIHLSGDYSNAYFVGSSDGHNGTLITVSDAVVELTGTNNPLNGVDLGDYANPAFVDLNNDGKPDVVVGADDGTLAYFLNIGSANAPAYVRQTGADNAFAGIDIGFHADPTFVTLYGDAKLDLVIGELYAQLRYFRNVGTAAAPVFEQQTGTSNPLEGITVGGSQGRYSAPAFADVNGDGVVDGIVGSNDGSIHYFKNTGTATVPAFFEQTGTNNPFSGINVGAYANPAFVDLDRDGKVDLVVGSTDGMLRYFKNTGTTTAPNYVEQIGTNNPFNGIDLGSLSGPTLADIDADGIPEALVGTSDGMIRYLHF